MPKRASFRLPRLPSLQPASRLLRLKRQPRLLPHRSPSPLPQAVSLLRPLVRRVPTSLAHRRVFLVLVTILLLLLRAWRAPALPGQVKVLPLVDLTIAAPEPVLPSSSALAALVAQRAQVLVDQVQDAQVAAAQAVPVVRVALVVVRVPVVVAAVPAVALQAHSAAVAARASPVSRSEQSVKSLKCGRHQA